MSHPAGSLSSNTGSTRGQVVDGLLAELGTGSLRDSIVRRAVEAGSPEQVAAAAAGVTAAKFGDAWDARAEAYFWGCVRRRALRGEAPRLSQRLVLAGLAQDLAAAGRGPDDVFTEMSRLWSERVDAALLEPYRPHDARVA
jgi:hypothetical protein